MLNYLPMNPLSLQRNLRALNEFLEDYDFPKIQKKGDFYSLGLSNNQKKELFSKIDVCSSDQRTSYLFIKLMLKGFINLEQELNFLGVSRTTINRDFDYMKEKLGTFGVNIKYIHGKGITLDGGIGDVGFSLCQQIMKMLAERDFLPAKLNEFISGLLKKDMDEFYSNIREICQNLGIPVGEFAFYFIYAQDVAFHHIDDFEIPLTSANVKYIENSEEFINIRKKLSEYSYYNEKHLDYLACCLYNIKNNAFYSGDFKVLCDKFFSEVSTHFKIDTPIHERLKLNMANKLYMGAFKHSNKIISAHALRYTETDRKIINFIISILKKFSFQINYSEIPLLAMDLKKIFIMNFLMKKIDVLVLLDYLDNRDIIHSIQEKISNISPNINFTIEPFIYYDYFLKTQESSSFNLIISSHVLEPVGNSVIKKISSINLLEIEELLYQFFIEESLKISENIQI